MMESRAADVTDAKPRAARIRAAASPMRRAGARLGDNMLRATRICVLRIMWSVEYKRSGV